MDKKIYQFFLLFERTKYTQEAIKPNDIIVIINEKPILNKKFNYMILFYRKYQLITAITKKNKMRLNYNSMPKTY